ncbi:MAG: AP2 domain-containing protein [Sedimentisphaerales bacterium]|jgi:hypothetical protein
MSVNLNVRIPEWLDKICACPLVVYRRLKYGYSFRKIYLGQNEYTIVEPADYYAFGKYNWILIRCNKKPYAISEFKIGRKKTKRVYLHRAIMKAPKRRIVDHRNCDGLDNRRANLRFATYSQNLANRSKTKSKTTSKYRGVYFDKRYGKWNVRIKWKYKTRWLGRFENEIDAARAYDKAARKYHKDFARLNFPE